MDYRVSLSDSAGENDTYVRLHKLRICDAVVHLLSIEVQTI